MFGLWPHDVNAGGPRGETLMKASLYLRVSSNEQTVRNQLPALQEYARVRGWTTIDIYQESESAWKAGHQQELARLLSDCRNSRRHPDVVLVWALDRLSRQGSAAILNLVNRFQQLGVRVVSIQEPWTEAPGELAEILYAVAGWVARMESQRRSERTKAGLQRLRSNGKNLGRPLGSRDKKRRQKRSGTRHAQLFTPNDQIQ